MHTPPDREATDAVVPPIPVASEGPARLSFGQEGLWAIEQLSPGNDAYQIHLLHRLEGALDAGALARSLCAVVERHQILRTNIQLIGDEPVQIVGRSELFNLSTVDLTDRPAPERLDLAQHLASTEGSRPLDLVEGFPIRATLYHLGVDDHLLHIAVHHIAWDGWSTGIFWRELGSLYDTCRAGQPSSLASLAAQYRDYAHWIRKRFDSRDAEVSLRFWRERLTALPRLDLPSNRRRPAIQSFRGRTERHDIPADLTARLKAAARARCTTFFMVLAAAFHAYLSRLCRSEEIVIGTALAGRDYKASESLIGLFVNAVPMRTNLAGDPPFGEMLRRVRDTVISSLEHGAVPFEKLVAELRPARDLSRHPLFQTAITLQSAPAVEPALTGLRLTRLLVDNPSARFDLTVSFTERAGVLESTWEYATDLFDPGQVRAWARDFTTVLETVVAQPDVRLSELPAPTPAAFGIASSPSPRPMPPVPTECLHTWFERQAAATPDRVAVVCESESLTYRELDRRAGHVAAELRRRGAGAESLVALLVDRSAGTIAGLLGILKAGAAYVPLDPSLPDARIAGIIADADIAIAVTQSHLRSRLPGLRCDPVCLDTIDWSETDASSSARVEVRPDQLAYIIYTSGSTGQPKGVCVEHRSIVNYVAAVIARLDLSGGLSFATVSTIAADLGNTVLFPALVTGGCLHVIASGQTTDAAGLAAYFRQHEIDVLKIVPSHLAALQSGGDLSTVMPRRRLILGGEASRLDWVRRLARAAPGCSIHNHYGPTEATVGVLTCDFDPQLPDTPSGTFPLGRPLDGVETWIVDDQLRPVPDGEAGELCLSGVCLARGYLNQPALTAERFVIASFPPEPAVRVYRTGDRVRRLPDGSIEFLGRIDDQVKIRGHRVEPGEVEAVLCTHPGVATAAVVARDAGDGSHQLAAYVVPRDAAQASLANLPVHEIAGGLVVAHLNRNETDYIAREIFELQAYVRHGIELRDGSCIVDAGANIGLFTLFASRLAPEAHIVAFEPNPAAFECLQANARAYTKQARCLPFGLSHEERDADLVFFEGFSLLSGFYADAQTERNVVRRYVLNQQPVGDSPGAASAHFADEVDGLLNDRFASRSVRTRLRTLSSVVNELGLAQIDLLKINVEKSELDILRGIEPRHWPCIRQMVIEVDLESHLEPITALLQEHGFDWVVEQDELLRGTALRYVYAIRPSHDGCLIRTQAPRAHRRSLPRPPSRPLLASDLRHHLTSRLPDYLVPAAVMFLEAMPLNANGKLDRHALPAPRVAASKDAGDVSREITPIESTLATIWRDVLGRKDVGRHENFFEIGGDSILAIRIANRARNAGFEITARQFFEHPTIAGLATFAEKRNTPPLRVEVVESGTFQLTPVQQWFFEQQPANPHHWNQVLVLEARTPLDGAIVEQAFDAVVRHHAAFRLRFRQTGSRWTQEFASPGTTPEGLHRIPATSLSPTDAEAMLRLVAGKLNAGLDIGRGPLIRAAWLERSESPGSRLLLVAHHLVCDSVSWDIFTADLEETCRQIATGAPVRLEPPTASMQQWVRRLERYAQEKDLRDEAAFWLRQGNAAQRPLPADASDAGTAGHAGIDAIELTLDSGETGDLLQAASAGDHTRIHELLVAAVLLAAHRNHGVEAIRVLLEGHGREELWDDLPVSRTIGWFTTLFPVRLALDGPATPQAILEAVTTQLHRVPNRGLGYGILRFLARDHELAQRLRSAGESDFCFNHLGQSRTNGQSCEFFRRAPGGLTLSRDLEDRVGTPLNLTTWIEGNRLHARWSFDLSVHRPATVEAFARDHLAALHDLADGKSSTRSVPAFDLVDLTQEELRALFDQAAQDRTAGQTPCAADVEDVLPATPMQEGMFYHAKLDSAKALYWGQFVTAIKGRLDVALLRDAWANLARRQPCLRSVFIRDHRGLLLQVVLRDPVLPWRTLDWTHEPRASLHARLEEHLRRDRADGCDLARRPAQRLTLIHIGPDESWLCWSIHHAISDGWSIGAALDDVLETYENAIRGRCLPYEPSPYRDFAVWLKEQDLRAAERHFRTHLAGVAEAATLPWPAPEEVPADDAENGCQILEMSPEATAILTTFARSRRLTMSTLVQAAWALLLHRYCGSDDVVFGVTLSGRSAPVREIESMLGCFVNTLPLRVRIDPRQSVTSWLAAMQNLQADLQEHQHTPLPLVQAWAGVTGDRPLFQSILVFVNLPPRRGAVDGIATVKLEQLQLRERTNYPITLHVRATGRLMIKFSHDTGIFSATVASRMVVHLRRLLEAMVAQPDLRIEQLTMMDETERRLVRAMGSNLALDFPRPSCVHHLVEAQVRKTPDAVAVESKEFRLTYRQLDDRANQLANHLRRLGIGERCLIGVAVDRTPDLIAVLIGIHKAGCAYVPLDPGFPCERLSLMVADSAVSAIVTHDRHAALFAPTGVRLVRLEADAAEIARSSSGAPSSTITPDDLAYVIYTSGSTGVPKGVEIEHRAIANFLFAMRRQPGITASDVLLSVTTISFDIAVLEIFLPLTVGARVVVATREETLDGRRLAEAIGRHAVTILQATPATWRLLLDSGWPGSRGLRALCGGEALVPELARRLHARCRELWNMYGPTETTVWSTCGRIDDPERISIGHPIANTSIYILDRNQQPVPVGVPGEMFIGGAGLARGYHGRPDLTSERFLASPFGAGERIYRTGDRAVLRADGSIECLGRADRQVKIRGFRIELEEIEAVLTSDPGLRAAVVTAARIGTADDLRLIAHVVPREGADIGTASICECLRAKLPDYMIPHVIMSMERLPLLPNGKVDRRALPLPDQGAIAGAHSRQAPRNPMEESLASIWNEVLGTRAVGVFDDFFEYGGHSLLAMQIVARIDAQFGMDVAPTVLFQKRTIAELAAHLESLDALLA